MDNEKPAGEPGAGFPHESSYEPRPSGPHPAMPKAGALDVADTRHGGALAPTPEDRTGVFRQLVTDDGDIAGLVAYSIYKQNKLDWLSAFTAAKGRPPKDDELAAYIIGEGTPRRLATYRHLAEATLSGEGPDMGGGAPAGPRGPSRRFVGLADRRAMTTGLLATYGLVAILFVFAFYLAAHYTMTSR